MKKRTSIVLLIAMLASLAACGDAAGEMQTGDGSDTTAFDTTTAEPEYTLPEKDMGGWELSILNPTEDSLTWANTRIIMEELNGDVLNDAFFNRNQMLMEKYNFVLKVDEVKHSQIPTTLQTNVLAGDDAYQIYVMDEGNLQSFLPYNMDWNEIPGMNLDKVWWNPAATSVYNINGRQTALAGNMSLSAVSRSVCMVFNKDIWAEHGDPKMNLYDLVKNNEWTLDKCLEVALLVSSDLDGDTKWTENDLYGLFMGRGFKGYIASFLTGCGMNFTAENDDGVQEFTLNKNERGIGLITKLVDALGQDGYTYYTGDVHTGKPANFFENDHALFSQRVPNDIYKLRDMEDDIGILPMPKYDASQENYIAAAWGGAVWTLSKTFDMANAENLGIVLEAMSYTTYNDIVPVYKEIALKTKAARDNESAEMLDIIFNNIYFDFGTNIMYDAVISNTFLDEIFRKWSGEVIITSMKKALPTINKYIDDINELTKEA